MTCPGFQRTRRFSIKVMRDSASKAMTARMVIAANTPLALKAPWAVEISRPQADRLLGAGQDS